MADAQAPDSPPENGDETPKKTRQRRRAMTAVAPEGVLVPRPKKQATPRKKKSPAKQIASKPTRAGYKHDWPAIKRRFIEGVLPNGAEPTDPSREWLSLKETASRENVSYDLIRTRSSEEQWFEQRENFQMRLARARQAKRIQELSNKSYEFDESTLKVAQMGVTVVTARMAEIVREIAEARARRDNALLALSRGEIIDPDDLESVIDGKELNTLAQAAALWQQVGQKSLGTDITKMEIQHDIQHNIDLTVDVTTIAAELGRDDPDRLADFFRAANRAGLLERFFDSAKEIEGGEDVVDAEVVSEEPSPSSSQEEGGTAA